MHCPNILLKFYNKRWNLNIINLIYLFLVNINLNVNTSLLCILQKMKANVLVADRKMRKLIFSLRPKEKEELIEKKRNLMVNNLVTITFLQLVWSICC